MVSSRVCHAARFASASSYLFLVIHGAQMYAKTIPPPKIKAIIAKVVHVADLGVIRVGTSRFIAGSSATSSVVKPHLLALAISDLRRRDAFSQDLFDVRLDKPSKQFPKCPIISRRVSFLSQFKRCGKFRTSTEIVAENPRIVDKTDVRVLFLSPNAISWSAHFRVEGDIISFGIWTALPIYAVLRHERKRISSDELALYDDRWCDSRTGGLCWSLWKFLCCCF